MTNETTTAQTPEAFVSSVTNRVNQGDRFCGLFASPRDHDTRLLAVVATDERLIVDEVVLPAGVGEYPSLTPEVPAAAWYEREIRDLYGLDAVGHAPPDPLIFPFPPGSERPRPGSGDPLGAIEPDSTPLPAHLSGEGVFTIPYGPVRSGIFESIEYLVETPGEDIPYLRTRVFYKHRGVEKRFENMDVEDGVLLAERVEGVASVAHAIAFCSAIERIVGVEISVQSGMVRVIHAELERIANHLDSTLRHTETAGQAVAYARLTTHKERVLRLRSQLCGSRFGRGVIVPGGVTAPPRLDTGQILAAVTELESSIRDDCRLLLATPSFVDRLRSTGVLSPELAKLNAALGPVGRGSDQMEDVRFTRPYAGYRHLGHQLLEPRVEGDALARQYIRLDEMWGAFHLIRQAADELDRAGSPRGNLWRDVVEPASGEAIGWAEAPQGEVLYLVELDGRRLLRVKPRSASFHNLALFSSAFPKDILTDFAFIEASFGLSIAGVAN
jgi:Ni,Fe-hydrogenase III large subunit